jgi:glycosyltransferase involved in cell wall biosynthesis
LARAFQRQGAAPESIARTMRICHVIESSSGGSSQVVLDLLRSQLAGGDDVTLIYSPVRAEPPFTSGVEALGDALRVRVLPMERMVGPSDLTAAWGLWRLLRDLGPFDVIHGHSSKAGALTRLAGLFLEDTVIVYTPHAFVTLAPGASRLYGAVEWLASWFCDAIILGSRQELQHARGALRLPTSRLRLIRMGVDLGHPVDRDAARAALGLSAHDFALGFVGRLVPQKNPRRLAKVFGRVARERTDARFVVIGDGPLREQFAAALRAEGVAEKTRVTAHPMARDLIPGFDCLVCASDYESFGLIFPESLAAGVPIVSPPVGAAEDAIIEGTTGRITSFDPEDIAKGVLAIAARDAGARARMSAACRQHSREFDFALTAARTRALYEELTADGKTPGGG